MTHPNAYPHQPPRAARAGWVLPSVLVFILLAGLVFAQSAQYLLQLDQRRLAQAYARHIERVVAIYDEYVFAQNDAFLLGGALDTALASRPTAAQLAALTLIYFGTAGIDANTPHFTMSFYVGRRNVAEPVQGIVRITPRADDGGITQMAIDQLRPSVPGGTPFTLGDGYIAAAQILASIDDPLAVGETAIPSFALSGLNFDYLLRQDRYGWFTPGLVQGSQIDLAGHDITLDPGQKIDANTLSLGTIDQAPAPIGLLQPIGRVVANDLTIANQLPLKIYGDVDVKGALLVDETLTAAYTYAQAMLSPNVTLDTTLAVATDVKLTGSITNVTGGMTIDGATTAGRVYFNDLSNLQNNSLTINGAINAATVQLASQLRADRFDAIGFTPRDLRIGTAGTPGRLIVTDGCTGC